MTDVVEKIARAVGNEIAQQVHGDGSKGVETLDVGAIARAALDALAESVTDETIDAAWEAFRAPTAGMHVNGEPSHTKFKLARAIRAAILAAKG